MCECGGGDWGKLERCASQAAYWAVQSNMPSCLKRLTTRAGMRIVGVRAMPGKVFASEGMAG
jgi:hypothetical protein